MPSSRGRRFALLPEHVQPYLDALRQHPSEATNLLAAAVLGIRGRAEIRDEGALVDVNPISADTWSIPASRVLAINELAQALTFTRSLVEAERLTEAICGRSELAYERRKASSAQGERPPTLSDTELALRVSRFLRDARGRGADLVTYRRITDAIGSRAYEPDRLRAVLGPHSLDRLAVAVTTEEIAELNPYARSAPR